MNTKHPKFYKYCVVPLCKSTTIKTPNKLFIYVPHQENIRKKWLKLARRDPAYPIAIHSRMYFCEDHFDLPKDMLNYMEYNIMGSVSVVRMKPGCLPKKFECQLDRRKRTCSSTERPYMLKKQRRMAIEECLNESEESRTQSGTVLEVTFDAVSASSGILPIKNESEPKNEAAGVEHDDVIQSVGYQIQHNDETSEIIEEHFYDVDFLQSNEEQPSKPAFSWQKDSAAVACETVMEVNDKDLVMQCDETDEPYMYSEAGTCSARSQDKKDAVPDIGDLKQDYKCNLCSRAINGPRYTCVQCVDFDLCATCEARGAHALHYVLRVPAHRTHVSDFDLCATCEARGAHALHYVLRVPAHRTHNEMFAVLQTLRRILVTDSVIQMDSATVDELKVEVKEEVVDPIYVEQVTSPAYTAPRLGRGEDIETEVADLLEEDEKSEVFDPLEEDIETGVADPLEEDVEMLEKHLDSEAEPSHSKAHDTKISYVKIAPKPTEPLYMVVGLDNQRQMDVRLSNEMTSRELRDVLGPMTANVVSGLSSTSQSKFNAVGHRKLNTNKTNTQTRFKNQTTHTRPSYRLASPRLSSLSTEALHRKFSPVQVYSYNVQNTDVSQAGTSRDLDLDSSLGKSSRPAQTLAMSKDDVISAVKRECAREIPNILHKNTDVRQENAPAMVPRVVLEDICATRKS